MKTSKLRLTGFVCVCVCVCVGGGGGGGGGIRWWPENSPHKRPVTRKMFPFDDVIMMQLVYRTAAINVKTGNSVNKSHFTWVICFYQGTALTNRD